ncbi:MAG: M28 family peptidase [Muribaculaceae bacterium]|nr:M28 family peptidase [Muribaculaceae bacterium]
MHLAKLTSFFLIGLLCLACSGKKPADTDNVAAAAPRPSVSFNADSALSLVRQQCEFGPRVPETKAHELCLQWILDRAAQVGAEVTTQKGVVTAFNGVPLNITNVMASILPHKQQRILLLAHYDSRPWADNDPDPANHKRPVMGANDGASGVAVMLELARVLQGSDLPVGIDLLFVDAEDYGDSGNDDSWALGTQFWAASELAKDYHPMHAILLDMVGATGAQFGFEYFTMQYAAATATAVWDAAASAGFAPYFVRRPAGAITDDHVTLCRAGIPCIDIIDLRDNGFFPQWHTVGDTMQVIDPATLKAVGQTLVTFITSLN